VLNEFETTYFGAALRRSEKGLSVRSGTLQKPPYVRCRAGGAITRAVGTHPRSDAGRHHSVSIRERPTPVTKAIAGVLVTSSRCPEDASRVTCVTARIFPIQKLLLDFPIKPRGAALTRLIRLPH
jgi:hypothetical protein